MKRLIFVLLIAAMALTCFSCAKLPETGDFECEFDKENKTAVITKYNGKETTVTIPETFEEYTVIEIGRNAFKENYDISEVVFPETIKRIGQSAFELCISIEEIKLPEALETIGNTAFANCRGLKKVDISSNVNTIGICAFTGCTSLETINVANDNKNYVSDDKGVLFTKDYKELIQYPLGSKATNYEIPNNVTSIASYAFEKAQFIEKAICPDTLKAVGSYAFQASTLKEISFKNGFEEVGAFAFNESKLTSVELGTSIKKIGESAFAWCTELESMYFPDSVEEVGISAFFMCTSISEFTVIDSNKYFTSDARGALFDKDKTTLLYYPIANTAPEYMIPNSVTKISANAFSPSLKLTKVTIPDSVETIEDSAFAQCANLTDVIYEGTQPQNIAENAFDK